MSDKSEYANWNDVTSALWEKLGFKEYKCSVCGASSSEAAGRCHLCGTKMKCGKEF